MMYFVNLLDKYYKIKIKHLFFAYITLHFPETINCEHIKKKKKNLDANNRLAV